MSYLYQPTPLEQAYTLYVGQQVFGVLPGATQIQISGRDAVPFLTQSNVDRGILRSLWTVADPQNIGTLSQLNQLQLLLRLVSMAQTGLLNPSMTVDTVKSMVQQYSSQQLNLPSFSSVMVPHQDQLMNAYGSFVIQNTVQPVSTTSSQQSGGGGGGFWSLSSYSSPSLVGNYGGPSQQTTGGFGVSQSSLGGGFQQSTVSSGLSMGTSSFGQTATISTFGVSAPNTNTATPLAPPSQRFGGEIPEGFNTATQLPTVSVSDAFGDIDAPTDAPLPSLGEFSGSVNDGGSVDQSEISGSLHQTGSKESISNTDSFQSALQNTDSFQSGPSVQSGGFQQADMGSSVNEGSELHQQPQQSDAFGSFGGAAPTSMTPQPAQSDDFGDFTTSDQSAAIATAQSDDFGGFETAPGAPPGPMTDESDPFGAMSSSQDAPLPSLEQTSQPFTHQQAEEDDFGGFEGAAHAPVNQDAGDSGAFGVFGGSHDAPVPSLGQVSQPVLQQAQSDDFGVAPVPGSTVDESDPFGAMIDVQDAPLPSLDQFSQPVPQQQGADEFGGFEAAMPPVPQAAADDFGGFETAEAPQADDDDFGGFETAKAPAPTLVNDESDPFGPLAGSQDAPLPLLDEAALQIEQESEGGDFGGFETAQQAPAAGSTTDDSDPFGPIAGAQDAPLPSFQQPSQSGDFGGFGAAAASQVDQPSADSDPFEPIATSQDAPLPPLGQSAPLEEDESDDFGGFETAAPASADIISDNSDPFGPSQDAPLPSLAQPVQPSSEDESFGGFEASGPSSTNATDEDSDPFGQMAGTRDAPLPTLDQFSQAAPQPAEADDFGGFEDATPAALEQADADDFGGFETAEGTTPVVDESDPFGPLAGREDAPLPALGQPSQRTSQEDDFGGFGDAVVDDSDPFGPIAGSDDAPLPSLGQISQPVPQDQEDDFGGLEDVAPAAVDDSDPFGPIAGSHDAPLPPLGQMSQSVPQDDFGGFEDAAPLTAVDDSDPFGPIAGSSDAPLPPLGQMSQPVAQDQEDDFGGFEAAVPASVDDTTNKPDLFGPMEGGQEPIEIVPATQASGQPGLFGGDFNVIPDNASNNNWGAFDSSAPAPPPAPSNDAPNDNQDKFGAFNSNIGTAAGVPAATIAQGDDWGGFDPTNAQSNDDDFGAFDSNTGVTSATLAQLPAQDDEWGAFDSNTGTDTATASAVAGSDDDWGAFDSNIGSGADAPALETPAPDNIDAPVPVSTEPKDDDWGAFDSNAGTDAPSATVAQPPAQDDEWGGFDSGAPTPSPALSTDGAVFVDSSAPQPPAHDDDWGAFDSSAPAPAPAPPADTPSSDDDDDWGAFDSNAGADIPPATVAQPPAQDDDWGGFDSGAPAPSPGPSNDGGDFGDSSAPQIPAHDDGWGAFDSSAPAPAPAADNVSSDDNDDDDWGAFDSNADADVTSATVTQQPPAPDDDWGAFDSSAPAPAPPADTASSDDDDDWGAFDSNTGTEAPSATVAQPPPAAQDDDWGDFGKATPASQGPRFDSFASSTNYTSASGSVDGNLSSDDEFGDFGDAEGRRGNGGDHKKPKNGTQDKIRAYASQLPESLLRKSGLSGEHVDLVECFEVNIGSDAAVSTTTMDPAHKATVDRCLQILAILKKKRNSKLPLYWEQLFLVVKEELQFGKQLLMEASSKKLSKAEHEKIQQRLVIMISGFCEYLRVVRSIVGTIGDLLLLDVSALLTIDTYASTWCSLDILKIPVEIEQLWKDIEKAAAGLSIRTLQSKQQDDTSMSLTSIRRKSTERAATTSEQQLCELTLVPLSKQDRDTTCSIVSWQGKGFMACSANILANRCPFYVVVE
ncbi:unnamed protein product [Cylindrotheca closterium]|uniref:Synergin gamma C-terminal domain-containing protein n=1 Tax=Cylindrotheca closterium TaxID=2856 RepID=A0AAD2JKC7_9STRA|nr:unnamed protein product [Cylindrotheca closterium]